LTTSFRATTGWGVGPRGGAGNPTGLESNYRAEEV
jgi:hypothetical protein